MKITVNQLDKNLFEVIVLGRVEITATFDDAIDAAKFAAEMARQLKEFGSI